MQIGKLFYFNEIKRKPSGESVKTNNLLECDYGTLLWDHFFKPDLFRFWQIETTIFTNVCQIIFQGSYLHYTPECTDHYSVRKSFTISGWSYSKMLSLESVRNYEWYQCLFHVCVLFDWVRTLRRTMFLLTLPPPSRGFWVWILPESIRSNSSPNVTSSLSRLNN